VKKVKIIHFPEWRVTLKRVVVETIVFAHIGANITCLDLIIRIWVLGGGEGFVGESVFSSSKT